MISRFHPVKVALTAVGVWALCVIASVTAAWVASFAIGARFNPSDIAHVVVLSTVLVAVVAFLGRPRRP